MVLYQGHVYGLSDGIMECVNVASGKRVWKKGRYGQGQILGVGGVLRLDPNPRIAVLVEAGVLADDHPHVKTLRDAWSAALDAARQHK